MILCRGSKKLRARPGLKATPFQPAGRRCWARALGRAGLNSGPWSLEAFLEPCSWAGFQRLGKPPCHCPSCRVTELSGGQAQATELPTATLLNTAPAHGEDVERVSTGTKFALQLWLDTTAKQQSPRSSSS